MNYADLRDWVSAQLTAAGYAGATLPDFDPGPVTAPALLAKYTSSVVFLTLGNGIGLTTEQLYDQIFITVRAVGEQDDYDGAEKLAKDLDNAFLSVGSNTAIGSGTVLYIVRTGGAPQLIDFDSGSRYHFQTTYITEVKR